jgi:hypothetical protein
MKRVSDPMVAVRQVGDVLGDGPVAGEEYEGERLVGGGASSQRAKLAAVAAQKQIQGSFAPLRMTLQERVVARKKQVTPGDGESNGWVMLSCVRLLW